MPFSMPAAPWLGSPTNIFNEPLAQQLRAANVVVEQKTYSGVTHEFFGINHPPMNAGLVRTAWHPALVICANSTSMFSFTTFASLRGVQLTRDVPARHSPPQTAAALRRNDPRRRET